MKEIECDICLGRGWYVVPDEYGEPIQMQCESCYGTGCITEIDNLYKKIELLENNSNFFSKKGKLRTYDTKWYFIPENYLEEFDDLISRAGLLEFFGEEWTELNNYINGSFASYELSSPITDYVISMNWDDNF